jgi:hypothetical protein
LSISTPVSDLLKSPNFQSSSRAEVRPLQLRCLLGRAKAACGYLFFDATSAFSGCQKSADFAFPSARGLVILSPFDRYCSVRGSRSVK